MRTFPCYPIIDDHEIVDNWGTRPEHQQPEWQAIGEGARAAYMDYQGSRIMPLGRNLADSLHYMVSYGNLSVFVMDLRSTRTAWEWGTSLFRKPGVASAPTFCTNSATRLVSVSCSACR